MTVTELKAKRDSLVKSLGLAAVHYTDRSVQYGDIAKAIEAVDIQIDRQTALDTNTSRFSTSYIRFTK